MRVPGRYREHMLDAKLQVKPGWTVAIVDAPGDVAIDARRADAAVADAVLLWVPDRAALDARIDVLRSAAARGAMTWIVYPKAKQLGTDLNRDIIHGLAPSFGLDPVRQIAVDDVWSALRLVAVRTAL